MSMFSTLLKPVVGAIALSAVFFAQAAQAQDPRLDPLFESLAETDPDGAPLVVEKIVIEWSKSGSPAMDYLLRLGRAALEADDYPLAAKHFRALTDHAPQFAEGWHGLAMAYFNQEKIGPALAAIENVLALEPRHFQAMEGLMVILEDADLVEEALQVAEMIRSIHPHHPDLSSYQARLEDRITGRDL